LRPRTPAALFDQEVKDSKRRLRFGKLELVERRKTKRQMAEESCREEQILLPLGQPMSNPVRQDTGRMIGNALFQHKSNRLDLLAAALAEVLAKPVDKPFTPELVVVQSLPLRRWLAMRLAEANRIFANVEFPFLATFVFRVLGLSRDQQFSVDRLTWKIFAALPALLRGKNFAVVAEYLRDADELKRFQLSVRVAQLFDQYRVYRPEMIAAWETGRNGSHPDERWQSELWREVLDPSFSSEALRKAVADRFSKNDRLDLPARIAVFAPTALPPIYLDLLFRLSEVRELHLFQLQPSPHYRGDDLTKKQRARVKTADAEAADGNPLATSWGRLDVEVTNTLLEAEERHNTAMQTGKEAFVPPEANTLLAIAQSDVLYAVGRGGGTATAEELSRLRQGYGEPVRSEAESKTIRAGVLTTIQSDVYHSRARSGNEFATANPSVGGHEQEERERVEAVPGDGSLSIHACHSPMREVEVLYDQLLELFDHLPGLQPRDVLVMSPDIESYSPLIRAVFGYSEDERMRIPFSISDRAARNDSLPIDTYFGLLDLAGSRFTAPQIFALLSSKSVRRKFGFNDEELALIREWIDELAIRWGIDEEHQKTLGVPGSASNTWAHGLDRLLLGYATPGENRTMFSGILPYDKIEGETADCLGRFVSAVRGLSDLLKSFSGSRTLLEWVEILQQAVEQFLEPAEPEDLADIRFVRAAIETLREFEANAPEPVEFSVVRAHVLNLLEATAQRGTFFTGGVTFCSLKPVRSVPARVICLLGLNDKLFPRRPQPPQFDLMAGKRRSGDPSATLDDRYAFLEALMAAQDCVVITYIGRSAVHNKRLPPSVVVSELLDYAGQAFVFPGNSRAEDFLVREHPLHGFSPRYFLDEAHRQDADVTKRLCSYSAANAEAARSILAGSDETESPFIGDPLPPPVDETTTRDLRHLTEFIVNPPKFFLRHRLGMQTKEPGEILDDTEPFKLDGLDGYRLKEDRVIAAVDSESLPSPDVYRALGVFPAAAMGELELDQLMDESQVFTELVNQRLKKVSRSEPVPVDIALSNIRLTGTVAHLFDGRIIRFRPTTVKPRDRLSAWIEHLALCATLGAKAQECTILSTDLLINFAPIENAIDELEKLNALFDDGRLQPLPFFPRTSWAYMADVFEGNLERAVKSAWKAWHGDRYNEEAKKGEKHKPEMQRCFSDQEPFRSARFDELARAIYEPMHKDEQRQEL
jgi:exodeoxyribonuclease V gamma subunit